MKALSILFLAACSAVCSQAQTVTPVVISSNGGNSQNSSGSIEWTVGEPVGATYVSGNHITTMGFHQPVISVVEMLKEEKQNGGISVYPNPVKDELSVDFSGLESGAYALQLVDAAGRLIMSATFVAGGASPRLSVPLQGVAAGTYFLKVNAEKVAVTVKINKVQ